MEKRREDRFTQVHSRKKAHKRLFENLTAFGRGRTTREGGREVAETTKIPVVAIGYQDTPDGFRKLLVNEPSGSTHVYNPERHIIAKTNEKPESSKGRYRRRRRS
jgi:hypothetical protein